MRVAAVAGLLLVVTCTDVSAPLVEADPDISSMVLDSAAAALDSLGHFQIDADLPPASDDTLTIDAGRARELAQAFVSKYGAVFLTGWQGERGGPISLNALVVSPRVYPAATAFQALPATGCHPSTYHLFASKYVTMFVGTSGPQLVMGVSARTLEYSVDGEGDLIEPSKTGNDFGHEAIPAHGAFITAPEQAVALVARATNAKVTRVPSLTLRRNDVFAPTTGLWRIDLDRAVAVRRASGNVAMTSRVYVSPTAALYVPADTQPSSVTVSCPKSDGTGFQSVTVPVRAGRAIDFELVVLP